MESVKKRMSMRSSSDEMQSRFLMNPITVPRPGMSPEKRKRKGQQERKTLRREDTERRRVRPHEEGRRECCKDAQNTTCMETKKTGQTKTSYPRHV